MSAQTETDTALLAADLRGVMGQLIRRLRRENLFPMNQASVLGRLDRCGSQSVSDLAAGERVRPQSMAQTVGDLEAEGLVERKPDPDDRRRALVILTDSGKSRIEADRRAREGWLVKAFEEMPETDVAAIERSVEILRRVADADV
ncbi:MAG TPA: MarR family transcriptional regulator [Solirubrobacterales bacterium]|jgi:DNA-binding MarR family transcriptional regulator|nr:MarR family transcriptional regulator [Solirubrobacterales bacterium]